MSLIVSLKPLAPLPPLPPAPDVEPVVPIPPAEELPEEEQDIWWIALAQLVGEWIIDNILRPGMELFIKLVEWITAELKYWKKVFFEILAEIYATDFGFLMLIAGTIVAAIYVPQLLEAFWGSSIGTAIASIMAWIKQSTGKLLEWIGIVDIYSIGVILQAVWPEWRELCGLLADATSALAEQLGQGTGYLHAWFSVVRSFTSTTAAFLDIDPKVAELWAFEEQEKGLRRINERFREYAHDPGKIIRDIIEEIYIPQAGLIRDAQQGLIGSVADGKERTLELYESLRDTQGSLDHFIAIQPEETASIIEEKLGPIAETLDSFLDDFQLDVLPAINLTLSALEQRADWIEQANAIAATRIDDPLYALAMYDLMTPAEQSLFNRGIMLIAQEGLEPDLEAVAYGVDRIFEPVDRATKSLLRVTTEEPIEIRPVLDFELPGVVIPTLGDSWYQGEY